MGLKLQMLQSKASEASKSACKNGSSYYKYLLEQNKEYIQDPPSVQKCADLSKQLFYTRLASIPHRYESFWKELNGLKELRKTRPEIKKEDLGIVALFGIECFAWFCGGEIFGRGSFIGYRV